MYVQHNHQCCSQLWRESLMTSHVDWVTGSRSSIWTAAQYSTWWRMHNNMTQHDSIDYISCHIIVLQNRLESSIEPLLPVYQRVVLYGTSTIHEASGLGGLISLTATSIKYLAARPANHQDYWPLAPYCWRWIAARWKSRLLFCVHLVCWRDPVSWLGFPAWYNLRIGR